MNMYIVTDSMCILYPFPFTFTHSFHIGIIEKYGCSTYMMVGRHVLSVSEPEVPERSKSPCIDIALKLATIAGFAPVSV